jgi:hypothetical protein
MELKKQIQTFPKIQNKVNKYNKYKLQTSTFKKASISSGDTSGALPFLPLASFFLGGMVWWTLQKQRQRVESTDKSITDKIWGKNKKSKLVSK